jgi:hypothetical protein
MWIVISKQDFEFPMITNINEELEGRSKETNEKSEEESNWSFLSSATENELGLARRAMMRISNN